MWQMIGNDCCVGVESGDNAAAKSCGKVL